MSVNLCHIFIRFAFMNNFLQKYISKIPKHSILLLGIVLFVFVFPIMDKEFVSDILITISYSVILLSVSSIVETKKKFEYFIIILAVISQWILFFFEFKSHPALTYISFSLALIVFIYASIKMVKQIISTKEIDARMIIETLNGYLLVGVIFTMVNILLNFYNPNAIRFTTPNAELSEIIYYSFITITTIGYGDIAPVSETARSFAIFFGLTAQLYLTIVMAFIIGKYLNSK